MSTQSTGWAAVGDTFAQLVGVYGQIEVAKQQAKAQENYAGYNQLMTMPQDLIQNPNARPMTAQEIAYLYQQNQYAPGLTNQNLLLIAGGLGVLLFVLMK